MEIGDVLWKITVPLLFHFCFKACNLEKGYREIREKNQFHSETKPKNKECAGCWQFLFTVIVVRLFFLWDETLFLLNLCDFYLGQTPAESH